MVKQIDLEALHLIQRYPLVVLSQRIKIFAQSIGFNQIKVATKTFDEGLFKAIQGSL
jgi:uroporphyrinogen-III synthase